MNFLTKIITHSIEAVLLSGAGLSIIGIRPKLKKIFLISALYVILALVIRSTYIKNSIPLGTHSMILFTGFCLLLIFVGKQKALNSIVATLIGAGLIFLGEGMVLIPLLNVLNLDPVTIFGRPEMFILAGILSNIPLIIVFVLGYVLKITLINFDKFK